MLAQHGTLIENVVSTSLLNQLKKTIVKIPLLDTIKEVPVY